MSTQKLRVTVRLVLLFSLVFALSLTQGWATTIGSSTTSRPFLDSATGQVYIYDGATFQSGDAITTFNWFGPVFSGSRDLTPLLFSESLGGVFTVVAIGATESVSGTGVAQSFSFGLQAGSLTAGTNWVFGFVTGLAGSTGTLAGTSAGSINFDSPIAGGTGVSGGSSNNDWVFTPSLSGINVNIGTTFGANSTFALNNPALGPFNVDRTYSANVNATTSGVAEPGTFSLITGAGLVLAGLFRYRYSRGRRS
jgi:hypothetical protein